MSFSLTAGRFLIAHGAHVLREERCKGRSHHGNRGTAAQQPPAPPPTPGNGISGKRVSSKSPAASFHFGIF